VPVVSNKTSKGIFFIQILFLSDTYDEIDIKGNMFQKVQLIQISPRKIDEMNGFFEYF
jgi:hypothetical protein